MSVNSHLSRAFSEQVTCDIFCIGKPVVQGDIPFSKKCFCGQCSYADILIWILNVMFLKLN